MEECNFDLQGREVEGTKSMIAYFFLERARLCMIEVKKKIKKANVKKARRRNGRKSRGGQKKSLVVMRRVR